MNRLVLFGAARGFALRTIHAINAGQATWDIVGFIDDDPELAGSDLLGHPFIGDRSMSRLDERSVAAASATGTKDVPSDARAFGPSAAISE